MTFITKRTIPRRAVLRGLGASVALPFLDGMVPGLSARAAAGPVRFGAVYVPNGMVMQNWTPAATGRRLRADADSRAAGPVPRPAAGAVGAQLHAAAGHSRRQPLARRDPLPDRRASRHVEPRGGLDGPDRGPRARAPHAAGIARAGAGGRELRRLVRQRRVQLRLLVHHLVARLANPAPDGAQPAGGVRAALRRQRDHRPRRPRGAPPRAAQHSRLGARRRGPAPRQPRGRRPPEARRVPRRGARRGAAHRGGRGPGRARGAADGRGRWGPRPTSPTTRG